MRAELAEAVELMRPHFPEYSESDLLNWAGSLRARRYQDGRWPDFAEMAKEMAKARLQREKFESTLSDDAA
jgi:hypothetical protein